jgi:leucyl aminopeptidase
MKVSLSTKPAPKAPVDVLAIGVQEGWSRQLGALNRSCRGKLLPEAKRQNFNGQPNQLALVQTHGAVHAPYILLYGVGDAKRPQSWYELAQAAVSRGLASSARHIAVTAMPETLLTESAVELLAQGILLARYSFQEHKKVTRVEAKLRDAALLVDETSKARRGAVERGAHLAKATCYARDLSNRPAEIVTPIYLAEEAQRLAKENDLQVRILDGEGIAAAKMGGLLGVGRGSVQPPRFIELIYRPEGRPTRRVALVGKGITFDTGGLSLKNASTMEAQKRDMAGGAAVLATMSVVRQLGVRAEVRGYVAAAENMPSGAAMKPGDILTAANGTTIEVLNTDAEGRLVLADALSCAAAAHPDVIIDLATLTGAVRMALGPRYAAIMGTQPKLVRDLITAGAECDERLWELPLVEEYRQDIASTVADLKNTGGGSAGTIIGGLFLREFVGRVPWAHIDFSSTVMADKPRPCHPVGATGFGVRTLLHYLRTA